MKVNKPLQEKPISNMEEFYEFSSVSFYLFRFDECSCISIHSAQNNMCTLLLPGGYWVVILFHECDARHEYGSYSKTL